METKTTSYLDSDAIELHYWFDDDSHTMDAYVQHRCETEFLGILKALAVAYDVEISVETEPMSNGGLRRRFRVRPQSSVSPNANGTNISPIKVAIITALLTALFVNPIGTSLAEVGKKIVERVFEDKEQQEIDKDGKKLDNDLKREELIAKKLLNEKLALELNIEKEKIIKKNATVEHNLPIKKRRSNFYESLGSYPKVTRFSVVILNQHNEKVNDEQFVEKKDFKNYVLSTDVLEPTDVDEAVIEIISPVLKKGNYQWRGVYNGEVHPFNMKSSEFKALVQSGHIEFKNGTSIRCAIQIEKKMDGYGNEIISKINIIRVDSYFDNDQPIETPEGKKHRKKKEDDQKQLKLDF